MFRVSDFQILEFVDRPPLLENVVRTDEDDVLLLEVAVGFALVQGFGVAQGLVVAGAFRQFAGVLYLHFYIECADGFALGPLFLYEYVVTDSLVEGTVLGGFLRFGFLQVEDLDAEQGFEEGLRDVLMAEH